MMIYYEEDSIVNFYKMQTLWSIVKITLLSKVIPSRIFNTVNYIWI